jgi:membrane associated rhomboid family serine protease
MSSPSIFGSAVIPLRLIFLMWAIFYLELILSIQFSAFGIVPRNPFGVIGIFTAPFLHGSFAILFYFYSGIGTSVFLRSYFWTNILVWLFGRGDANHIGASGVVYGLAFFLIFFGFFRRDFLSIIISLVVLLLYGGVFYGVLPTDPRVSWESHFAGALVGISTAITYSRKKTVS